MDSSTQITALIVLTVVAGIFSQVLAKWLRLPSIVLLLLSGIILGPSGLGLLHPNLLGDGLEVLVPLCVALILFEGGLNLDLSRTNQDLTGSLWKLITVGALITLVGAAGASHWLGEFPWQIAWLYASLVIVTGPTVVGPLLKQVGVQRKLAFILEGEGVLIDPIGAIVAVVVLNVVLQKDMGWATIAINVIERVGIGLVIGLGGGWLLSQFLRHAKFLSEELRNLMVLAVLWGLFLFSQQLMSESGLLTAVLLGTSLRLAEVPGERLLRRFKGQLSTLAISVLFVLLAADLSVASMVELGWSGVATVLCLIFLVRPVGVWLCTWGSDLTWQQKTFLSWIAPRGIVAASVASLFSISLTNAGMSGGDAIKALVFLTILMTVFLQGLTAKVVAGQLQLRAQETTGVLIVGCNPLSILVAEHLRDRGEVVTMIDSNPESCAQARQQHFRVFCSSALDTEMLQEAGMTRLGTFLAMTSNTEVNAILAQRAIEEFHPPRVLAALASEDDRLGIGRAFQNQVSVKDWNDYIANSSFRTGEVLLEGPRYHLQVEHIQALMHSGKLLPLLIERSEGLRIVPASEEWQVGDRLIYVLHTPKPHALPAALTSEWRISPTQIEPVLIPPAA